MFSVDSSSGPMDGRPAPVGLPIEVGGSLELAGQPEGDPETVGADECRGVVVAERASSRCQGTFVEIPGRDEVARGLQIDRYNVHGVEGALVLVAERFAIQLQRPVVQVPGVVELPVDEPHPAEPFGQAQGVWMALAQVGDPVLVGLLRQVLAAGVITPVVQELDDAEDEFLDSGVIGFDRPGDRDVWAQCLVTAPLLALAWTAGGFAVGEQGMCPVAHDLLLFGRDAALNDGLDEPVHLQRVVAVVDAGQGVALDVADRPAEPERVGQGGVERRGDGCGRRAGEEIAGDGFRGEERTYLEQLQGCLVDLSQLVQRDVPGNGDGEFVIR